MEVMATSMLRAGALALAALLLASGCARKEAPAPRPVDVLVVPVVQMDVPVVGEWIGTLDGSVNADIRPKIEGYLLREFYKEGQFVHRNDLRGSRSQPGESGAVEMVGDTPGGIRVCAHHLCDCGVVKDADEQMVGADPPIAPMPGLGNSEEDGVACLLGEPLKHCVPASRTSRGPTAG